MKTGFDYKQYEKWVKNYGIMVDDFQLWLKQFLLEMAQRVVANAKKMHRAYKQQGMGTIDTGAMINSWYIGNQEIRLIGGYDEGEVRIDVSKSDIASIAVIDNYLQVEIGNSVDYASYIEYGHGSYQPRYILTISIRTIEQQIPKRFDSAWKKFLKDRGVG